MRQRLQIYFKWLLAGFPIMLINYAAFLIAIKYVDSKYAFWTWVLVSPLTYETWRYVEKLKTW